MQSRLPYLKYSGLFLWALALSTAAAADSPDNQMRNTLRSTMQALNAAEADKAALQSTQLEDQAKIKDLTGKVQTMIKRGISDKADADKAIAAMVTRQAESEQAIARLRESLDKSQGENKRGVEALHDADKVRAKLEADNIVLQRQIADVKARNAALFKLGNEILTRYEKYSLGQVIAAKEPFVGRTRTKLENQIQDSEDKLLDQRVTQ